jgi:acyl-CoA thioester hydrolase
VFAVRSVQVDYLRPARLDDQLEITASDWLAGPGEFGVRTQTVERINNRRGT